MYKEGFVHNNLMAKQAVKSYRHMYEDGFIHKDYKG